MATIVVEALISASVELLLNKIISGEFVDFFRITKLDVSLLERLRITLSSLKAVLNEAEQKRITNPAVKEWLVMLQDAVFDAEDLFDEINTEALRCQIKAEYQGHSAGAKVKKFLSSHFKSSYGTINSKMQKLLERLGHFAEEGHHLGLREGVSSGVWHGTPTSSVAVDESAIYGRDNDRKKLKDFLLSDDAREGDGKIGVVSIVGMGGLGKTTLAKQLFNDPEVKEKFNLKGWAHISKDFNVLNLTKALLESITALQSLLCLWLKFFLSYQLKLISPCSLLSSHFWHKPSSPLQQRYHYPWAVCFTLQNLSPTAIILCSTPTPVSSGRPP